MKRILITVLGVWLMAPSTHAQFMSSNLEVGVLTAKVNGDQTTALRLGVRNFYLHAANTELASGLKAVSVGPELYIPIIGRRTRKHHPERLGLTLQGFARAGSYYDDDGSLVEPFIIRYGGNVHLHRGLALGRLMVIPRATWGYYRNNNYDEDANQLSQTDFRNLQLAIKGGFRIGRKATLAAEWSTGNTQNRITEQETKASAWMFSLLFRR
ncbi:MAG: hypothetical protein JNN12_14975 [Bacteroidetes Order II. Incertae sedis bacterium]|nr:hypothetical protein [Bacteroidetes Order II. bacterium]